MAKRIFLDANILFSASKGAGAVRELLFLLRRASHEIRIDEYVTEEARRNLAAKAPAGLEYLHEFLQGVSIVPLAPALARRSAAKLPDKDAPVLDAAIRSACDLLVTGDKTHFGRLYGARVEGVEIVSPAMLAATLIR